MSLNWPSQHNARLEVLLEENRALSTKDLHDSGVRTLCISDIGQVDLDKVIFQVRSHIYC